MSNPLKSATLPETLAAAISVAACAASVVEKSDRSPTALKEASACSAVRPGASVLRASSSIASAAAAAASAAAAAA